MSEPPIASDTETSAPAPSPWRRLLWLLAPLGLWIAATLTALPGVDPGPLLAPEGESTPAVYEGLLRMALTAIVTGYVLVEIVAVLAVPWRHLRHTRRGRTRLALAALVVALVLSAVSGWQLVRSLFDIGWLFGPPIFPLLSLAAATAVAWAALHAADRNGVGSSFALLIGLVSTIDLARAEKARWIAGAKDADLPQAATFAGLLSLAALATLLVLKKGAQQEDPPGAHAPISIRIPTSGLLPFWTIGALPALVLPTLAKLPGLAVVGDLPWLVWLLLLPLVWPWLLQAPSQVGAAWAVLFEPGAASPAADKPTSGEPESAPKDAPSGSASEQPTSGEAADQAKADAAYAPPLGGDGTAPSGTPEAAAVRIPPAKMAVWAARARAVLLRAMVPTLAYLAVVAWPVWPVLGRPDDPWRRLAWVAGACLLVAAVRDIVAETRFRMAYRGAVPLHAAQDLAAADAALAALSAEGIPAFARNSGVRTLLSFFGPFAPLELLVPEAHVAGARRRLAAVLPPEPAAEARSPADGEPAKPGARKKAGTAKRRKPKQPVTE